MSAASASPPGAAALPRPAGRTRILGVDVARAVAIVGMLTVHVGPTDVAGPAGTAYAWGHGRASILFGVVAGVGVALLAASRTTGPWQARAKLAWRAAILLPLGLALQDLDHGVFVILQDYALLFALGALVLGLRDRTLLALAACSLVGGTLGYLAGLIHAPGAFAREAAVLADPLGRTLHRLVLSGPYPLITWAGPFLLGIWIGRRDLRRPVVRWWLVGAGAVAAALAWAVARLLAAWWGPPAPPVGWDRLLSDAPHSQMPLWLVGATGSAALVLGASLLLAERLPRGSWPLAAVGQLAFTLYVGHLLALHAWHEALTADAVGEATAIVAGFTAAFVVVATAWRAALPRGPLELVLHLPWLADPGGDRGPSARDQIV